jgi:hypothetical protein
MMCSETLYTGIIHLGEPVPLKPFRRSPKKKWKGGEVQNHKKKDFFKNGYNGFTRYTRHDIM